uniref:Uncharacterized protein n=1 Tax=Eutreptiella gymnastica TaxID=73025 RepID=A0A7S1JEA7_9EUGL
MVLARPEGSRAETLYSRAHTSSPCIVPEAQVQVEGPWDLRSLCNGVRITGTRLVGPGVQLDGITGSTHVQQANVPAVIPCERVIDRRKPSLPVHIAVSLSRKA